MLSRTEINTTMDSTKCQPSSCDALNTTSKESSYCVNYYDFQFCLSEEVKKEFPEDDCPQSSTSASQNEELLKIIPKQEIKQENSEDSESLIKNEEIGYEEYSLIIKPESLEEHSVLDNFENSSVHYDILVAPQQLQCKLCGRTFKNRFALLIHSNEHIKVVIYPTLVDNEMNELYKCHRCDEHFNCHYNMLAHFYNVHSNKIHNYVLYNEGIKQYPIGRKKKNGEEMEYKCHSCDRICKSKTGLVIHIKSIHSDYGKMFKCWCRKQFPTPILLQEHKYKHHEDRIKSKSDDKFQCNYCHKIFKVKGRLIRHIKYIHYDYGKKFECWCGKQFRTPIHLRDHKKRQHISKKVINNEQYQCDYCHNFLKTKRILATHIKHMHYDYGEKFECLCGKQFRTPFQLSLHKKRVHCVKVKNVKIINNEQYQCDYCHTIFKAKLLLIGHIKSVHHEFCRKYECWCGKQLRSRVLLSIHKKRQHGPKLKNINNQQFQCDYCHKFFKIKSLLESHIKSIHYDYGKVFSCSCGKQFRTPIHLYHHNRRMHCDGKNIKNERFQCDICQKNYKTKKYLKEHIKDIHYERGKIFECWCGKQFRLPKYLRLHKYRQHGSIGNDINNQELQCDSCGKFFKNKVYLMKHIRRVHYDYGRMFSCRCGKQFAKPILLRAHEELVHNNTAFQCNICKKLLKSKSLLNVHMKHIHYDYGKMFLCWCGKQFRTPFHLRVHERTRHKDASNKEAV